ncbi:hypothetical protein ABIC42_005334 [Variovorax sp. 1133]
MERFGLLADQQHAINAKTRGLRFRNTLHRRWRRSLRALVNGAFVLLTQGTLTLLLALLLDEGLWRAWHLGLSQQRSTNEHAGQYGT